MDQEVWLKINAIDSVHLGSVSDVVCDEDIENYILGRIASQVIKDIVADMAFNAEQDSKRSFTIEIR